MKTLVIVLGAAALALMVAFALTHPDAPPRPVSASQPTADEVYLNIEAEHAARVRERQLLDWRRRYGADVEEKLYHCESDPPQQPANQRWCKRMLARAAKEDAAEAAAEDREKAGW